MRSSLKSQGRIFCRPCTHRFCGRTKKMSSAVACVTLGRATSSSTFSSGPAFVPAARGHPPPASRHPRRRLGPVRTRNSRRATLKLTPLRLGHAGELVLLLRSDLDRVRGAALGGPGPRPAAGRVAAEAHRYGPGLRCRPRPRRPARPHGTATAVIAPGPGLFG